MKKNTPERVMEILKERTTIYEPTGCWIFKGPTSNNADKSDHCRVRFQGKMVFLHRLSAHLHWGFDLDSPMLILHHHFCPSARCWNPEHLREGTQKENIQDSIYVGTFKNVIAESRKQSTHCKYGHEFTPENTRIRPNGRQCKECQRIRDAKRVKMPAL